MCIAETDCVTIICPDVVENVFHGGTADLEAKLHEHGVKNSTSDCRLDDVGSIKTINTTAILSALCQHYGQQSAHLVLKAPFCSRMASPCKVQR